MLNFDVESISWVHKEFNQTIRNKIMKSKILRFIYDNKFSNKNKTKKGKEKSKNEKLITNTFFVFDGLDHNHHHHEIFYAYHHPNLCFDSLHCDTYTVDLVHDLS